jgi:hypothetical protein
MYHFLSGYTAKLAGTEAGMGSEPVPEFSACFGAPFLPLAPKVYAEMLGERLRQHQSPCWLVNTGWSGGKFGVGKRMSLKITRALVNAALDGRLNQVEFTTEPAFGLSIPVSCPDVPAEILNPRNAWADKQAYDRTAADLAARFEANFLGGHPSRRAEGQVDAFRKRGFDQAVGLVEAPFLRCKQHSDRQGKPRLNELQRLLGGGNQPLQLRVFDRSQHFLEAGTRLVASRDQFAAGNQRRGAHRFLRNRFIALAHKPPVSQVAARRQAVHAVQRQMLGEALQPEEALQRRSLHPRRVGKAHVVLDE